MDFIFLTRCVHVGHALIFTDTAAKVGQRSANRIRQSPAQRPRADGMENAGKMVLMVAWFRDEHGDGGLE